MGLLATAVFVLLLNASSVRAMSLTRNTITGSFLPRIPIQIQRTNMEPCSVVDSRTSVGSFKESFETFSILTTCATNNDGVITHFSGNYSLDSSSLICSESPLMSYNFSSTTNRTLGSSLAVCGSESCVAVFSENDTVFLSVALIEAEVEIIRNRSIPIPFLETKVFFEFDDRLEQFASDLVQAFAEDITDSLALRSKVFIGAKSDLCPFPQTNACSCQG